jgi:tripartite-type tricarboxylate transporter receptor subunit TctC
VSFVRSNRVKALAVTAHHRVTALPEIPTAAEAGQKELEVSTWYGLFVPSNTPKPIVDQIYAAASKAIASADVARQLTNAGADPSGMPPNEFTAFVKTERDRWKEVVKNAGIKGE